MQRIEETLCALESIRDIHSSFERIDSMLDTGEVSIAIAHSIETVTMNISNVSQGAVARGLRTLLRRKRSKLQALAVRKFENAFELSDFQILVRDDVGPSLLVLEQSGGLKSVLGTSLANELLKCLLTPIMHNPSAKVVSKQVNQVAIFQIDINDENAMVTSSVSNILNNILQALKFIAKHLLCSNHKYVAPIARTLWGTSSANVVQNTALQGLAKYNGLSNSLLSLLYESLPTDSTGMSGFNELSGFVSDFEVELKQTGFISSDNNSLAAFLADAQAHSARKRRASVLANARDIIVSGYRTCATTDKGAQTDLIFQCQPSVTSICVHEIVALAEASLLEASRVKHHASSSLYHTARDVLQMFPTLVPVFFKSQLASQSRLGLLFHNDCNYIAHRALTLGLEFRQVMPDDLKDLVLTVDLVPGFRAAGASALNLQIQLRINDIADKCFEKELYPDDTGVLARVSECFQEGCKMYSRVCDEWRPILSSECFNAAATNIAKALLESAVNFLATKVHSTHACDTNEILALRQVLQSFKTDVLKPLTDIDKNASMVLPIIQMSAVLEQYISLHIFKDMAATGQLSALSVIQVKGFSKFLFPSDI